MCSRGRMSTSARGLPRRLCSGMFPDCAPHAGLSHRCQSRSAVSSNAAGTCRIDPAHARRRCSTAGAATSPASAAAHRGATSQRCSRCSNAARRLYAAHPVRRHHAPWASFRTRSLGRTTASASPGRSPSDRRRQKSFLLEYAQGLPENQVAWGRASTPQAMRPSGDCTPFSST